MPDSESAEASVVVLDDEELLRQLLVQYLKTMGHSAVAVGTIDEARELISGSPAIRLVVADVNLDQAGAGAAFVRELALDRPDLGTLLISGAPLSEPAPGAFLMKPFLLDEFRSAVGAALATGSDS